MKNNNTVGFIAEDEFRKLCTESHVNAVKSERDTEGWDFLIEIPPKDQENISSDLKQGVRRALVQVKATTSKRKMVPLTVNNALKLAKSELPCFLVLFLFKNKDYTIYIQHFHIELMRKTLKSAREVSINRGKTNRSRLSISFKIKHDRSKDPIKWIIGQVRGFPKNYAVIKQQLADSMGYEQKGSRKAQISLELSGGIKELVDLQIGLKDTVNTSKIQIFDNRFGLEDPFPQIYDTKGKLSIKQDNPPLCRLTLQSNEGETIVTQAEMLLPQIKGLTLDSFRFQLVSPLFRIVGALDGSWEIKASLDKKMQAVYLKDLSLLLSWGGQTITIGIRSEDGSFKEDGKLEFTKFSKYYGILSSACRTIEKLEQVNGKPIGQFTIWELGDSFADLLALNCFMVSSKSLTIVAPDNLDNPGVEYCDTLITWFDFKIKDTTIAFYVSISIRKQKRDGPGHTFYFGNKEVLECFIGVDSNTVVHDCEEDYLEYENRVGDNVLSLGNIKESILNESMKMLKPRN